MTITAAIVCMAIAIAALVWAESIPTDKGKGA